MRLANSSAVRPYDDALIPSVIIKETLTRGWNFVNYEVNTDWISAPQKNILKISKTLNLKGKNNSFLYSGYLNIPADGNYTFSLKTEGQAFMRLHDIALIDEDSNYQSGTLKSQTLNLSKGFHPIKLYIKNSTSTPFVQLQLAEQNDTPKDINQFIFSNK